MLTQEQNDRLSRVGSGTPMGELLRRYWYPVAAVEEFGKFPLRRKLLGEDLIVYRDPSGTFGASEPHCPHRRASLEFACVEEGGIRCAYHGWKFDREGNCVDQPVEPGDGAKAGARLRAYPVEELGGLVWLYMGPAPAPLLPRFDIFTWKNALRDIGRVTLPCNFVQIMENSVDPHHVEWLHGKFANHARGDDRSALLTTRSIRIGFDLFDYGIIKRRMAEGETEESESWKVGHPLVFPNMLRVGGGGNNQMQIRVPIDDTTTTIYYYSAFTNGTDEIQQETVPIYEIPMHRPDGSYAVELTDVQDWVMWISQGPIADRSKERLGRSDVGIATLRKLYFSEMDKVERGLDPIAVVRDPAVNERIDLPQEHHAFGGGTDFLKVILFAGQSRFSPIFPQILSLYGLEELEPA